MKATLITAVMLMTIGLSACTDSKIKEESSPAQKESSLQNLVSIIEIPTTDFARAMNFYQTISGVVIEKIEMDGNQMGILPSPEGTVNVVLVNGKDYIPTTNGTLIYLNAGNDLQPMLDKIVQNGGKMIVPKTKISDEMGYFALFVDTEGNKIGLHSSK